MLSLLIISYTKLGCSSTYQVEVIDDPREYTNESFNVSGFRYLSDYMANSILHSKLLESKSVAFLQIYNNTTMHLNIDQLISLIIEELINHPNISIVERDKQKVQKIFEEWKLWKSGLISMKQSRDIGQLLGSDFFVYGTISSTTKNNVSNKSETFLLTLKMTNTESGRIVWTDHISLKYKRGRNAWEFFK